MMPGSSQDNLLLSQSRVSNSRNSGGVTVVAMQDAIKLAIQTGKNNNDELITIPKHRKGVNDEIYITVKLGNKNKQIELSDKNDVLTNIGTYYYALFNTAKQTLFDNERGIDEDNNITKRNGVKVKLLGTRGQILKKPRSYYDQAKQLFMAHVPFIKWFGSEDGDEPYSAIRRPVGDELNSWYRPVNIGEISTAIATKNPLGKYLRPVEDANVPHGRQEREVRDAMVQMLTNPDDTAPDLLVNIDARDLYVIHETGYTQVGLESRYTLCGILRGLYILSDETLYLKVDNLTQNGF